MSEVTIPSTGEQFVWCVFDCDGCECSDLVGVFATQEAADRVAGELRELRTAFWTALGHPEMGAVVVEQWPMNAYRKPHYAELAALNVFNESTPVKREGEGNNG